MDSTICSCICSIAGSSVIQCLRKCDGFRPSFSNGTWITVVSAKETCLFATVAAMGSETTDRGICNWRSFIRMRIDPAIQFCDLERIANGRETHFNKVDTRLTNVRLGAKMFFFFQKMFFSLGFLLNFASFFFQSFFFMGFVFFFEFFQVVLCFCFECFFL